MLWTAPVLRQLNLAPNIYDRHIVPESEKTMKNHKISSIIRCVTLLTATTLLCAATPAYANVSKEAEQDTEPAEIIEVTPTPMPATPDISYEPVPETTSQPFTIAGNGEILDDIEDGSKEFYTITTQNNNQFFIVVDKARASENVYMLARVDEADVAEFIEGYTQPTATPAPQVIIQQPTPAPTPQVVTTEPEEKPEGSAKVYVLACAVVLAFIAGAYYFKVYKPKHEEDDSDDEGMEFDDSEDEADDDE